MNQIMKCIMFYQALVTMVVCVFVIVALFMGGQDEYRLHTAIKNNDCDLAVFLIHQGFDVNKPDEHGKLPIQLTMDMYDDVDIYYTLKHLVLAGASLMDVSEHQRMMSEPWKAFHEEYEDYWKDIIENEWQIGRWDWIKNVSLEAFKQLLEFKQFEVSEVDKVGMTPLDMALKANNMEVVNFILENNCSNF